MKKYGIKLTCSGFSVRESFSTEPVLLVIDRACEDDSEEEGINLEVKGGKVVFSLIDAEMVVESLKRLCDRIRRREEVK